MTFEVKEVGRIAEAAEFLVDPAVGIVQFVREVPREPGGPNFFHFAARACDTSAFSRQRNFFDTGGASISRERAAAKALGEAIERYSSALFDIDELPLATYDSAPFACVDPRSFALFGDTQYDEPGFLYVPFNVDTPVRWTEMTELGTGHKLHCPAARVYMPYTYYQGSGDSPIDQPISTGLACHGSRSAAALAALCEVIERDAVSICWQAMIAPPQIRIETLDDENYEMSQRFNLAGSRLLMFDITLDHGVPTVLSVLVGQAPRTPGLVVAAATSPDPVEAVRKSLEELAHTRRYCQFVRVNLPPLCGEAPRFSEIRDQLTHLGFYANHDNVHWANFLFQSSERKDFDQIDASLASGVASRDLAAVVERVRGVGETVLEVELTTPDVMALGLNVVRCVVPGFHQIHMGHDTRSLGGKRLWKVPQAIGYRGIYKASGDNPAPHPYP
jgi:ribosomal protein S12 methylthiotransferase accessory factor